METKRKKIAFTVIIAWAALVSAAFGDVCQDIRNNYRQRIQTLERDTNAALSQTVDPIEISALRVSYQVQFQQLQSEMNSTLDSAGCLVTLPPDTGTNPPSDPDPTDPGNTDPGTTNPPDTGTDTDPGTNPGTDTGSNPDQPGNTHDDDDDDDDDSEVGIGNCKDQLKAYKEELKTQGIKGRNMVLKIRERAQELGCLKHKKDKDKHCRHCGKKHGHQKGHYHHGKGHGHDGSQCR